MKSSVLSLALLATVVFAPNCPGRTAHYFNSDGTLKSGSQVVVAIQCSGGFRDMANPTTEYDLAWHFVTGRTGWNHGPIAVEARNSEYGLVGLVWNDCEPVRGFNLSWLANMYGAAVICSGPPSVEWKERPNRPL
jgi:hypothetical protein